MKRQKATTFYSNALAKPYLGNLVSGLRFKPSTSWQKSEHTTLDNLLGISEMFLVQFTTTITLNRKLYSHLKEKNAKLSLCFIKYHTITEYYVLNWFQWPHGLRHKSAATCLLRLWVRNPTGGMYVCCECCVLSGRGLCNELITHPEKSYRLQCVVWSIAYIGPQCHGKKNSIKHRPSWEASSCSASQQIASFYRTWWLITMFTEAYCWSLFLARLLLSLPSHPISSRYTLTLSSPYTFRVTFIL